MKAKNLELRCALAIGIVDVAAGVIRGATVAKAGVPAEGHRVMLDAAGRVTWDEKKMVRELPVFTDEKTLETLMSAASSGGGKFKTREDHDDSIGARAGFASNFARTDDGRVTANIDLFESYRNRTTVLTAARETPRDIGLSIDFLPEFEILADRALMRVAKLDAVDIVDRGAITPGGMFLGVGVDTGGNMQQAPAENPPPPMAEDKKPASNEDVLTAMSKLTDTVTGCMTAMTAAITKMATPAAAPAAEAAMAAKVDELQKQLGTLTTQLADQKKERMLLGYRGTPAERVALGTKSPEEIQLALEKQPDFRGLTRAHMAANKGTNTATAQMAVLRTPEGKAAYRAHLDTCISRATRINTGNN